jgi:hypothetical protein
MGGPNDEEAITLEPHVAPITPPNTEGVHGALNTEYKHQRGSRLLLQMEAAQQKALADYHSQHAFINNTPNYAPRVHAEESTDHGFPPYVTPM